MRKTLFLIAILSLIFPFSTRAAITLDAPDLISPVDNAVVRGEYLLSDWSDVSGATKYLYRSYNDAAATSLRYGNTYPVSQKDAYNVGDAEFWWRVKALDNSGNESPWSALWHVTIDNTAPEKVFGLTIWQNGEEIGCGATVYQRTITVDWEDSTDPNFSHYVYQADDGEGDVDYTTTVVASQRTGDIRDIEGTYYYRVQAVDLAGNAGEWSDWRQVTYDKDQDDDGVDNTGDLCLGTMADDFEKLNPIHYAWLGGGLFYMEMPKSGKALPEASRQDYGLADTHGCSCSQILEWLNLNYPEEYGAMAGLKKHGCSRGIMEDFVELSSM